MKTFLRSLAFGVMLMVGGNSFAQKAHPAVHHPVKHYKHRKKVNPSRRGLPLPPPPGKLPSGKLPAPPSPGKLPAPPSPKLPALPHR